GRGRPRVDSTGPTEHPPKRNSGDAARRALTRRVFERRGGEKRETFRGVARFGHRSRDRARTLAKYLRPVLHHQGGRPGHGARPSHLTPHRRGARRLDRSGERGRGRRGLHCLSVSDQSNRNASGGAGGRGRDHCMSARILIAEDDADLRDLLQDELEDAGYETIVAIDGRAAMAHIERERERIDLLITDVRMPGLSGDELLTAMRTRRSEAPVIVITAFGSGEQAGGMGKAGAFQYLTKPFDTDDLSRAVTEALASIGGILLYVSTAMVKPADVKETLAMSKSHIGLMIYTAAMVVLTDFLTGVMTAITIYAVGYLIGKRLEARQGKNADEPAYSPTGD